MLCTKFPPGICTNRPISIIYYLCCFDTIVVWKVHNSQATERVINLNSIQQTMRYIESWHLISFYRGYWVSLQYQTIKWYWEHVSFVLTKFMISIVNVDIDIYTAINSKLVLLNVNTRICLILTETQFLQLIIDPKFIYL